jgi:hypothetical protein
MQASSKSKMFWKSTRWVVGATGIEPVTPSMSRKCSPAELRARRYRRLPPEGPLCIIPFRRLQSGDAFALSNELGKGDLT